MKNSFLLYTDYLEHIELLNMEQRGVLFTAVMAYASEKELPELDGMVSMAFSFIRARMDRDTSEYNSVVEARRQAGKMGGRPSKSKESNGFSEKQTKAKKANGFFEKQTKAKKGDNDNVNENDNENVNDKSLNTFCSERKNSDSEPVVKIILNDGSEYGVSQEDYMYFCKLYPAVDIMSELRKMAGWCYSNVQKRKTRRGIKRFINRWLADAQDKSGRKLQPGSFYDDMREWVNDHEHEGVCYDCKCD